MLNHLRDDISCILERDPAARSRFEILTCYPGLHAVTLHRLSHALWKRKWRWLARFMSHISRLLTGIEIHPGAQLGRRVFIDHGFGVVIGETAVVGDDCTIYQGVTLGGTRLYKGEKRHPTLEPGVVVGAGAQILGGFVVGTEARIGSNAVVVKPVPAFSTAVGNPARIIVKEDTAPGTTAHDKPGSADHDIEATVPDAAKPAASSPQDTARGPEHSHRTDAPCQEHWNTRPLETLLKPIEKTKEHGDATGFSPYAVDPEAGDPLVQAIQELVTHAACQEERINRLCKALDHLGEHIENGDTPLDKDKLDRLLG